MLAGLFTAWVGGPASEPKRSSAAGIPSLERVKPNEAQSRLLIDHTLNDAGARLVAERRCHLPSLVSEMRDLTVYARGGRRLPPSGFEDFHVQCQLGAPGRRFGARLEGRRAFLAGTAWMVL